MLCSNFCHTFIGRRGILQPLILYVDVLPRPFRLAAVDFWFTSSSDTTWLGLSYCAYNTNKKHKF